MKKIIQYFLFFSLLITPLAVVVSLVVFCISYDEVFSVYEIPWVILAFLIQLYILKNIHLNYFSENKILMMSFLLLNVFLIFSLITFDTHPVSDYAMIWYYANQMANEQFSIDIYKSNEYIYIYNWQLGITAFESLIIRVFGSNFIVLKILNVLLINITIWLTYKLSKKKFGQQVSFYTLCLYISYYPIIITCGQFSNQHIAVIFILIILNLFEKNTPKTIVLSGIFTALLNVIRPMGIILIMTFIVWIVYVICKYFEWRKVLLYVCFYFVSLFSVQMAIDQMFMRVGYADSPISCSKVPYFKFDKGLTGYNNPDLSPFNGDVESYNQWQKKKLIGLIKNNPEEIVMFVANKMTRYLGLFDYKFEHTYNHDENIWQKYPIKFFYSFGWGQYIFLIIFAIVGYYKIIKDQDIDVYQIYYLGITAVYIFIEAFTSYRYESYPILILFASYGCYICFNKTSIFKFSHN